MPALLIASQVIALLTAFLPTFIKVIQYVMEAAKKFPTSTTDRLAWVQQELKTVLPKLSSDEIYKWIVGVVNFLRLFGVLKS